MTADLVGRRGERQKVKKMKVTERDAELLSRINALGFMRVEQVADFWRVDFRRPPGVCES